MVLTGIALLQILCFRIIISAFPRDMLHLLSLFIGILLFCPHVLVSIGRHAALHCFDNWCARYFHIGPGLEFLQLFETQFWILSSPNTIVFWHTSKNLIGPM